MMKVGACERIFIENWGFKTDIFAKFSSFLTKIAVKFEILELKIVILFVCFFKILLLEGKRHIFLSNVGLVNGLAPQLGVL